MSDVGSPDISEQLHHGADQTLVRFFMHPTIEAAADVDNSQRWCF
jgi:hypothetical protein